TFWGEGLSQGHSEAVRRVDGVKDAVQYTVPIEEQLQRARTNQGAHPDAAKRHKRVCYVVAEEGEDQERIRHDIETIPDYFADYDTTVHFISEEDLQKNHDKMKHGGFVIRSGQTTDDHAQTVEFSLTLESNPEIISSKYVRVIIILHVRWIGVFYCVYDEEGRGKVTNTPSLFLGDRFTVKGSSISSDTFS